MPGDRDAHFDVTATDKSGPAVTAAARGLDNLGDQANQATRQLTQLERETAQLRNKMLSTAAAAKVLGHEFAKTGDTKVLRDFEKMTRQADQLGRVLKKIEPPNLEIKAKPGDDDSNTVFRKLFGGLSDAAQQAGKLAGKTAIDGFGSAFQAIPVEVKLGVAAGLGLAVAAAGPFIASALSGAVLTGVAGGGIAAGLILAAKDPAVSAAYGDLAQSIMQDLESAAKPFSHELVTAAPELSAAFSRELPRVRAILSTLSASVLPLTRGVAGFASGIMPGLQRAATVGAKIVNSLAQRLPALGAAVGHLLGAFAEGGQAAQRAIEAIVDDLTILIHTMALGAEASAPLLNALAKFDSLVNPISGLNRAGQDTVKWVQPAGAAAQQTSQDYESLAQSLGNTARQADALNASFDRLFSEAMNLDQANLAVKEGMTNLRATIKDNGTTLDDYTAKGQANVHGILDQIGVLEAKRQAEIAAGNGTKEATAKADAAYASNVASLRQVLINLGFVASDVDNLISKYQNMPDININVVTRFRAEGNAPGPGNSRGGTFGGMDGWAPARFVEAKRTEMAGDRATSRTGGPVEVHTEHTVNVNLDGQPFHQQTTTIVTEAERRTAWRAKVGYR